MRILAIITLLTFLGAAETPNGENSDQQKIPNATKTVIMFTDKGYSVVSISKSFLGRIVILLENSEHEREIVLNPVSGKVLRDVEYPFD